MRYHFVTDWSFKAPVNRVWDVIKEVEAMPTWWPGFQKAQIRGADKTIRVGTMIDASVKWVLGDLNLTIEVSQLDTNKKLLLKTSGDLQGTGRWLLTQHGSETRTKYYWDVSTTGWLINLVGLLTKPLLVRSHAKVMAAGYKALKSRIEG